MKLSHFLTLLEMHVFLLSLFVINRATSYSLLSSPSKHVDTISTKSLENSILEQNPEYKEKDSASKDIKDSLDNDCNDSDNESDFDSDDSDEDDDEEESDGEENENEEEENDDDDSKSKLNKSLSSSTSSKSKKVIQTLTNNRTILTTTLAIYAFRREIKQILLHLFTTKSTTADGKVVRKLIFTLNPTSILKIILFIDFMRKMQQDNSGAGGYGSMDGGTSSSSSSFHSGGFIGSMFKDLLLPSNHAFLPPIEQHYTFEKIHDRFIKDGYAWKKATSSSSSAANIPLTALPPFSKVSLFNRTLASSSALKTDSHVSNKNNDNDNQTVVVIDMKIDSNVNTMPIIRDQISFLIYQHRLNVLEMSKRKDDTTQDNQQLLEEVVNATDYNQTDTPPHKCHILETKPQLEVIILLESPGGSATDYGLASNQIKRLRKEPGIKVTICVDKVAASGGYMMACQASPGQLFAAPFALLGSIGVYGQTLNIHNTLQNWGVKPLVFRGGKDKAPVGLVGEITKEGIAKVQGMIDKTHYAFKRHVVEARPVLADDIDAIATGDVFLGYDALDRGLVDQIVTSDEYIWDKIQNGDQVLKLIKFNRPRLSLFGGPRYGSGVPGVFHSSMSKVSDLFTDLKTTLHKANGILDSLSMNNDGSNDVTKIVHTSAFGSEMTI